MLDFNMTKKRFTIVTFGTTLLFTAFYVCCGLFVVHPLGASTDGSTYLFRRVGTDMPFISSADGLLLKESGKKQDDPITLIERGAALSQRSDLVLQRRILKLPYSRELYLFTTGGVELDR